MFEVIFIYLSKNIILGNKKNLIKLYIVGGITEKKALQVITGKCKPIFF